MEETNEKIMMQTKNKKECVHKGKKNETNKQICFEFFCSTCAEIGLNSWKRENIYNIPLEELIFSYIPVIITREKNFLREKIPL